MKRTNWRKILCVLAYIVPAVFFVVFYLLMTMTYEDTMQRNSQATDGLGTILVEVYNYIPRIGEFFQRIAVHFMTFQTSFGLDLVFRLIFAGLSYLVIWLATFVVIGRRPRLEIKDALIFVGIFAAMLLSVCSEAFLHRFSYVSNYVLAVVVLLLFVLPFRLGTKNAKWWVVTLCAVNGFCFGISSEVTPLAALMVLAGFVVVWLIQKKLGWKDFWTTYRAQTGAVLGVLAGLVFFYLGAGLGERTGGAYSEIYDFLSPMLLFSDPLHFVFGMIDHVWYNLRYVSYAVPLFGIIILVEATVLKKKKEVNKYLWMQVALLAFAAIYFVAASLLNVHDDMYGRFMVPMVLAITMSVVLFVWHLFERGEVKQWLIVLALGLGVVLSVAMVVDMSYAMVKYNRAMAGYGHHIQRAEDGSTVVTLPAGTWDHYMEHSMVFHFKQLTPFDWGIVTDDLRYGP